MGKETGRPPGPKPILVDQVEIARRLGVKVGTVHQWRRRPYLRFPEPDYELSIGPVWFWGVIRKWNQRRETTGGERVERERRRKQAASRKRSNRERQAAA